MVVIYLAKKKKKCSVSSFSYDVLYRTAHSLLSAYEQSRIWLMNYTGRGGPDRTRSQVINAQRH